MNAGSIPKSAVLSVVAMTAFLAAPNGFATEPSTNSSGFELKPKTAAQEKLNVKDLDEEVSHLEVVDSNGNAYLLIPLKGGKGNSPAIAQDGKIIVEYVHPYVGRLGN